MLGTNCSRFMCHRQRRKRPASQPGRRKKHRDDCSGEELARQLCHVAMTYTLAALSLAAAVRLMRQPCDHIQQVGRMCSLQSDAHAVEPVVNLLSAATDVNGRMKDRTQNHVSRPLLQQS